MRARTAAMVALFLGACAGDGGGANPVDVGGFVPLDGGIAGAEDSGSGDTWAPDGAGSPDAGGQDAAGAGAAPDGAVDASDASVTDVAPDGDVAAPDAGDEGDAPGLDGSSPDTAAQGADAVDGADGGDADAVADAEPGDSADSADSADAEGPGATDAADSTDAQAPCEPQPESCNGADDDCDGAVDEPGADGCTLQWADGDGDGYGAGQACACPGQDGWAAQGGDCDDADASRSPAHEELCGNAIDDDCDDATDEPGATGCATFYLDEDADGYGAGEIQCLCAPAAPYDAEQAGDCAPLDPDVHPGAGEVCNAADDDCDDAVDEGVTLTAYADADHDGWGGPTAVEVCDVPPDHVLVTGDCDEQDPAVHPGAPEVCNGQDDDCNGSADDGLMFQTVHEDADGDGWPVADSTAKACDVPSGWALPSDADGDGAPDWDCAPGDAAVFPGAAETCDGVDNDCSGHPDEPCPTVCAGDWPISVGPYTSPLLLDLDKDGTNEIVLSAGGIRAKDATLLGDPLPPVDWLERTFADIDGDFVADAVQTGGVYKRGPGFTFTKLLDFGGEVYRPSVSDLNGDGRLDVFGELFEDSDGAGLGCRPVVWFVRGLGPVDAELVRLPYPPGARSQCGNGPAAADLDGDGVEELLFGQSTVQSEAAGHAADGRLYVYRCQDPPECAAWTVDTWSSGDDDCGAWIDNDIWVGDHLGDGGLHVFHWNGCSAPVYADGAVIGHVNISGTGPADRDGNGRLDEGTCQAVLDLDGDGLMDCTTAGGAKDAAKDWFDGYPLPHAADRVVAGRLDADGRAELVITSKDGTAWCYELGEGSWRPETLLLQRFAGPMPLHRNGKADPFEPNDVVEGDETGHVTRNQATRWVLGTGPHDGYRALIRSPGDVDWYEIAGTTFHAALTVPDAVDYDLEVWCESKTKGEGEPHLLLLGSSAQEGAGVDEEVNLGYAPTTPAIAAGCATIDRWFVRVTGKSPADHHTRPYLLRVAP